jgi:hypothetical protein
MAARCAGRGIESRKVGGRYVLTLRVWKNVSTVIPAPMYHSEEQRFRGRGADNAGILAILQRV